MKILHILALLAVAVTASAQAVRIDPAQTSTVGSGSQPYGYPQLLAVPGAAISICNSPVNGFPCTNFTTTYTDATAAVQCPSGKPVVLAGTSVCTSTSDAQGKFGFWLAPGAYAYNQTIKGKLMGPYPISVDGSSTDVLALLAQPSGASLIGYQYPGGVARTVASRMNDIFDAKNFGVVSDGSDQSARFQLAIAAINANGGGGLFIPYSPSCYVVSAAVKVSSNTTVFSDARATCVKKAPGTQPACSDPGCNSVFYNDTLNAAANIHYLNFTVDGNRDNLTGASEGFFGILLENASDSSVSSMIVKNTYSGGVTVSCGESPVVPANVGNNVVILNTKITNSRRNNAEVICGTNTKIIGGELSYATGGSLSTGVDVEPDLAGQFVNGFSMSNVEVHHNRDGGVLLQSKYDVAPNYSFVNLNVHDNGSANAGAYFTNFNVPGGSDAGSVSIVGGSFVNNAGVAGISVSKWKSVNISGETVSGSVRGLLVSNDVTNALLGPGYLNGSTYDLSVDGPNSRALMAGVKLAHGIIQPGEEVNVDQQLTGIPINFATNGLLYWPGTNPRTGATSSTTKTTVMDATNPAVLIADGGGVAKLQVVSATGKVFVGNQSATGGACLGANNNATTSGFCMDATGTKPYVLGLPQFADNAAAITGGLTIGMLYRITAADTLAIVH